jgi:NADPH:quinone reductase-like Zn-dependent oxidoreductase
MTPESMMALRAHARGGPEQLAYEPARVPVPGPGEALVGVHAAAITFAELTWDLTWTTRDGRDRTPVIPSHEVSGTVAGLGPAADGLAVGDEVYGLIEFDRDGAAADYVTLPAAHLAARPKTVSQVEAATLPLAALTAWQAPVDYAAAEPGERVLVQGGAGGVGSYAVQLAAILGGIVTATGSARQRDFVLGLGAATFLASGTGGATVYGAAAPPEYDVVIDTVGGDVLDASFEVTRRGGRLVTLSAPPSAEKAAARGVHAMFFIVTPDTAELARLATIVDGASWADRQPDLPARRRQAGVRERHQAAPAGQDGTACELIRSVGKIRYRYSFRSRLCPAPS